MRLRKTPAAASVYGARMLAPAVSYAALQRDLAAALPAAAVVTDPLRRFAYGTDASFYRLVPQLVVTVNSEHEVQQVLAACRRHHAPLTFRAAGTSLSGQAISDSVLVLLGDGFRGAQVGADGATIRLQPAVVGAHANRLLAPFGRKIGPDPASIDAAKIGGIAANNASGMCCGVRDNSYHTLAGARIILADGTLLDTEEAASVAAFRRSHAALLLGLATLARRAQREPMASRIRAKYRLKNTTGYGLNALVDFADPVDILAHLMIGSEGTLGFLAAVTYRTVPEHAHKAAALLLFDRLADACAAVPLLKPLAVAAVELMDRAALASVEHKPGMPPAIGALGRDAAALLVETRAESAAVVAAQVQAIVRALAPLPTAAPVEFSTDAAAIARLWKVRKGTFPSVGARRRPGTTVVIEDVTFPVAHLAAATLDLQRLLARHGYMRPDDEAIIFGHALEGNLHFVFTQDFGDAAEVQRYAAFMDDVVGLVVGRYDGALKAEHGTGRNMAPFVGREWGDEGLALMREIKRLLDPTGLLNPGVILNDDPQAHLAHLKPMPAAHPLTDRCIECGFCEPHCPSAALTFTPRQRITSWREITRAARLGTDVRALRREYRYAGLDTCAGCGLCALACPVEIETGKLVKALRADGRGGLARGVAGALAAQYGPLTAGVRLGLAGADLLHAALGTRAMGALTGAARRASGGAVPRWSPQLPRAAWFKPGRAAGGEPLVYFPSCAARSMGPARGDAAAEDAPTVAERVLRRAGFAPRHVAGASALCCGQPFESQGLLQAADRMSAALADALLAASDGGAVAVLFDTSPCADRMKRYVAERGLPLAILDPAEGLHDLVLPRLKLRPQPGRVAVHPVCSVRKQGVEGKLLRVVEQCSEQVTQPAAIGCCGWAGALGFTTPELNAHALRDLGPAVAGCSEGVATSRTCEIGLSERGGLPYRSVFYLVDRASR
ncbi:MAG: FAD-binding and (Fe-S)-binding domain-containing protein [Betaproteobacteria bacterium]